MRRIYWDTMLLIYLLDGNPAYSLRVEQLLKIAYERNDQLMTSCLGLGEVMAGAGRSAVASTAAVVRETIDEMGFSYLPFTTAAVNTFSRLRSVERVKTADAIHLACAAAAGVDLFLTNDKELQRLYVPGINFIADLDTTLL